jgi:hypothetical protein
MIQPGCPSRAAGLCGVERLTISYHGPSSRQLSNYLFQHAEGHPLFTVELLISLVEQDLLAQDDDGC